MDRITALRIFVHVTETLSFTHSAMAMGVARSSVTKAINDLEIEVGARLLDRTTRSVSLTRDGAAFLDRSLSVLESFDDAHEMFAREASNPRGRVRISVPTRTARRLIAPSLPAFHDAFPDIRLEVFAADRTADLVREGFDCVLRVGWKKDSELITRKLADMRLASVASPGYIARYGFPRSVRDLDGHIAVGYALPYTRRLETWTQHIDGRDVSVQLPSVVVANNAEMYIASCEAGMGLIKAPACDLQDALEDGSLVEVLPEAPADYTPAAIVYAHRRNVTPRVKLVIDWLADLVRNDVAEQDRRYAAMIERQTRSERTA